MIFDYALASLGLLAATIISLEMFARKVWKTRWNERGFSDSWDSPEEAFMRASLAVIFGLTAGLAFNSMFAVLAFTSLTWLSALVISTDLRDMKIPSEPVWTVTAIAAASAIGEFLWSGQINANPHALLDMVIAQAVVLGVLILAVIVTVGGIGSGDVRLIVALTMMTAWTGAGSALLALTIASIGFLITRKVLSIPAPEIAGEGEPVPFAPAIASGYGLAFVLVTIVGLITPVAALI